MSNYLADSEISRLCDAAAGVPVRLAPETLRVLHAARDAFASTGGTFDVTCRPQLALWRRASELGELPDERDRAASREASHWDLFEVNDDRVVKRAGSAGVDLGGIAGGYAIDRAVHVLREAGARGGMVDIGGDLACFGYQANGRPWQVEVRDPSQAGVVARIPVVDGAVATSGDYARYFEIQGARFNHILDPRSGQPACGARAATVVAPTAMTADIWATALSVLGAAGFARLPEDVEALVIETRRNALHYVCTPGFTAIVGHELPDGWECRTRGPGMANESSHAPPRAFVE